MKIVTNPPGWLALLLIVILTLNACQPGVAHLAPSGLAAPNSLGNDVQSSASTAVPEAGAPPPFSSRPRYLPGEMVDYTAQTGDTLYSLAERFNTTVEEILEANTFIPASATTMPPGMPMKIPIYYLPLWGSPYQIIPDSHFVNGPAQIDFDTSEFVALQPGWLKSYENYVADANRTGAEIVDYIALYYSISPRLLLALLEYHASALTQPSASPEMMNYPLGYKYWRYKGLFLQLTWAANLLNEGYYGYRSARLTSIERCDGRTERFDPWQNAATVSLHNYFNFLSDYDGYLKAISPEGFAQTYRAFFGDPWTDDQLHIPGSLVQPDFILPFEPGDVWALTGGPHAAWGRGEPFAALDFAPPSKSAGCIPSDIWATAVADGVVARSEVGQVILDLDGDGDERTGWNILYLHIRTGGRAAQGEVLKQGEPVGHPSCEGGSATGTHVHVARKYNGEWIPAEGIGGGVLAFNLEGWIPHNGSQPYLGTMTRNSQVVTACTCSNAASFIQSNRKTDETE